MVINVTQEDIEMGSPSLCYNCPIAWAAKRAIAGSFAAVDGIKMVIESEEKRTRYWLPEEARKFVDDFDSGRPVKPFSFEV